jgi:DNA mismatch endonuclease (patch repair protein)
MRANRRRDTRPELALRSELHRRGLRFRVDYAPDPTARCRVDIALTRARVVIFVDGCFWHSCPEHGTSPRANRDWWQAKLDRNVERDRANDVEMAWLGWAVLRVWEHEDPRTAADRIHRLVRQALPQRETHAGELTPTA